MLRVKGFRVLMGLGGLQANTIGIVEEKQIEAWYKV